MREYPCTLAFVACALTGPSAFAQGGGAAKPSVETMSSVERLLADAKSQHDDFRKASGTLGRAADAVVAAAEHTRDIERVRRAVLDAAEQAKALHLDDQRVRMWRLARDLLRRARSDTDGDLQHARWELHDALCAGGRFREAITVFEEWREASRKVPAAGAGELKKQRGHVEALRWGEGHAAQLARVRDYWMRTRDWRLLALAEPPGDKREGFWTAARREFTKGGRALLALKDGFGHPFVTDRLWDYGWMSFDVSVYRLGAEVWRALYETLKRSRENHDGYLQSCRHNFHTMLSNSGQPERALEVFEEWFAVFSVREVENLSGMQDARRHRATLMESAGRIRDSIPVRVGYLQVALANPRLMEGKESEVDAVRWALAGTHEKLLHYESATPIRRSILADRAKRLGRDHLDTLHARVALAWNLDKRGIYGEALKLLESAHDAYVEVHQLHDSNRILQRARRLLSEVRFACGDAKGALRLREKWFKVFAADTDTWPQQIRVELLDLALARKRFGDLDGALELETRVYKDLVGSVPEDDLELLRTMANMASTRIELGDAVGALELRRRIVEVRERALRRSRSRLANALQVLGRAKEAKAIYTELLAEVPVARREITATQILRSGLASCCYDLGDYAEAAKLQESILSAAEKTLAPDDIGLQQARGLLGQTLSRLGRADEAMLLFKQVYSVLSKRMHADDRSVLATLGNLVQNAALLGYREEAVTWVKAWANSDRRVLHGFALPPRLLGTRARVSRLTIDALLSLALGCGSLHPIEELNPDALLTVSAVRGIETRAARRISSLREKGNLAEDERLVKQLGAASARLVAAIEKPSLGIDTTAAVSHKEQLEMRRLALTRSGLDFSKVRAADLGRRMPEGWHGVSIVRFDRYTVDLRARRVRQTMSYCALILSRDGSVRLVDLRGEKDIVKAVQEYRRVASSGDASLTSARSSSTGRSPPRRNATGLDSAAQRLRKLVLDPVFEQLPPDSSIFLSVDASLLLVPFDSLPLSDGALVGSRHGIRSVVSLLELVDVPRSVKQTASPGLMLLGGLDYDRTSECEGVATQLVEAGALRMPTRASDKRLERLPHTLLEIDGVAAEFRAAFPRGKDRRVTGDRANKTEFFDAVKGARFVHLATHGYFVRAEGQRPRISYEAAAGLSPFVLTGLALSGANLPPDATGHRAGILTAEEILSLDLTQCALVALSACKTSDGVRRAGTGFASLCAALQGAGARRVLASLWEVGDENAKTFMVEFYRLMWREKKSPEIALWQAKLKAKRDGMLYRDWAGWVLSGR